jgi:anti-sigma B factor antagonist
VGHARGRPVASRADGRPGAFLALPSQSGERSLRMSQTPRRHVRGDIVDGVSVVSFLNTKIVTEDGIQEVGEELYSLVDDLGHKKLLLNFGNVPYLSSAALGKLMELNKKVAKIKGKVKLCCIHRDVLEAFDILGLDRVFEIYAEEQKALDSF